MKTNYLNNSTSYRRFSVQKTCVIIPTYNNDTTLKQVLEGCLVYTNQIIVVNDGSTDETYPILEEFENQCCILHLPDNLGKGNALLEGFRQAKVLGYSYAITIDSDGQHYPDDLLNFISEIEAYPNSLIIGARNMDQSHIPSKSTFGNRFSNFWFWVTTGIHMPDTQSGYRLYPISEVTGKKYFSTKYELEIEIPVRASWNGVAIRSISVRVYYPPADKRVSHFRPFKDFTRISILNTFLTFFALIYIHPRDFLIKFSKKKAWVELYRSSFRNPEHSAHYKAISLAFGVFMGVVPIWGFQLIIGIPLALLFRLNKALFLIGANISIFPITPLIWALSLLTGKWILGYNNWSFKFKDVSLNQFIEAGFSFFLGGTVLAITLSILTYFISRIFNKSQHS